MGALEWSLVASVAAVLYELAIRWYPEESWLALAPIWLPTAFVISYAIYRLQHVSGSLIDAVIVFTLGTALTRLLVSLLILREVVSWQTWAAFGLVIAARALQVWR